MRRTGRARTALQAAALAGLMPGCAVAEERLGWHAGADAHRASLFYGIPQSDHAPVSFSCTPGGGLTFAHTFVYSDAIDGAEVEVLLQAGDITVPIRTTGMHLDPDGRLYLVQGSTILDDRLTDLITSDGTLRVLVGDGAEEYPLAGARDAAASLLRGCAGRAPEAGARAATLCRIRAWSTDIDPAGLNVRAGPGTEHAVIGRLPPPREIDGMSFAAEVSITGSQDGWFRIDAATTHNYVVDTGPEPVFEGEGWVSGRLLGLSVEGRYLFAEPSRQAPVVLDLHEDPERRRGPDYAGPELERLHACMGNWAEVEVTDLGRRVRGWTDDICASQVTTCP